MILELENLYLLFLQCHSEGGNGSDIIEAMVGDTLLDAGFLSTLPNVPLSHPGPTPRQPDHPLEVP